MSVNSLKIDEIASNVIEKLSLAKESDDGGQLKSATANFVGPHPPGYRTSNEAVTPAKIIYTEETTLEEKAVAPVSIVQRENAVLAKAPAIIDMIKSKQSLLNLRVR
eukprot:gene10239-11288_t